MSAPFREVAIIGSGLIGSSILRASKVHFPSIRLSAFDANPDVRAQLVALDLADHVADTATAVVADADLIILCVPVGSYADVVAEIAPYIKAGAIVSDVGSVKAEVIAQLTPLLPPHVAFVPAHPVAGTEKSGPAAGFASLFANRWCILTPQAQVPVQAVAAVTSFWQGFGANVERMDANHHDLVLAVTSHVPHLIAYTIVGTASDLEGVTNSEIIKFSAGGFRDFTRIAASDPTMWRDVFLHNRSAVLEILQRLTEDLTMLQRAIRWGEGETLFDLFTRTRAIRRQIVDAGQDTAASDFGRPHGEAF